MVLPPFDQKQPTTQALSKNASRYLYLLVLLDFKDCEHKFDSRRPTNTIAPDIMPGAIFLTGFTRCVARLIPNHHHSPKAQNL